MTAAPSPAVKPTTARVSYTRRAARSGGVHVQEAVAAAEARLDDMRDAVLIEVDRLLATLDGWRPDPETRTPVPSEMRRAVDSLVGLCAFAELPELGRIAGSCCRLLARERDERFPDFWRLHMNALKLFRSSNGEARRSIVDQVLKGLSQISSGAPRHA